MIDKIIAWLNMIPADKYKHFAVGVVICAISTWITGIFTDGWMYFVIPISMTAIVATGKEVIDDKFSLTDIIATILGGIFITITQII